MSQHFYAYPGAMSGRVGSALPFHLGADNAGISVTLTIRPLVETGSLSWLFVAGTFSVPVRTIPHTFVDDGLAWPETLKLTIEDAWPSGLYLATFESADWLVEIEFAVLPRAEPTARIVYVWPFTTGEAYYGSANDSCAHTMNVYQGAATENRHRRRVSFNRPWVGRRFDAKESAIYEFLLNRRDSLGHPLYEIDSCSSVDLHEGAIIFGTGAFRARRYDLVILAGHDEYWSREMRDALKFHVESGGRLLVASGNTCWWQVRLSPDAQGRPNRTMTVYKTALEDPLIGVDDARASTFFCSSVSGDPENSLIGASYRNGGGAWSNGDGRTGYVVLDPSHWVFAGLGLARGSRFAEDVVAYETDATLIDPATHVATGHDGTPRNYTALAKSDLGHWRDHGQGGSATFGYFRLPGGGAVFHLGAMYWGRALENDVTTQRIIERIVERLQNVDVPLSGPDFVPPVRELQPPSLGWQLVEAKNSEGPIVALTGSIEGNLFAIAQPSGGAPKLLTRKPYELEGVVNPWSVVDAVPSENRKITALAAYAIRPENPHLRSRLYAFAGERIFERLPTTQSSEWAARSDLPSLAARAATFSYFRLYVVGTDDTLYRDDLTASGSFQWLPIGRAPGITTIAWGDTCKLFGVRGGRLVARDACDADLAWVDIGPLPNSSIVALGWYYGTLYAQDAAGRLWRRTSTAHYEDRSSHGPWRPGQIVACRRNVGRIMSTQQHGRLLSQREFSSFNSIWTHIVFADESAKVVFYDRRSGAAAVATVNPDTGEASTLWEGNVGAGYTAVVRAGNRQVLFYGQGSGRLDQVQSNGTLSNLGNWPNGFSLWSHVVATSEGMLLFYNSTTGTGWAGRFVGTTLQGKAISGFATGWRHIVSVGNGCLLFHTRAVGSTVTGDGALARLPLDGVVTTIRTWSDFSTSLEVIGLPTGAAVFYRVDGSYETYALRIGKTTGELLLHFVGSAGSLPADATAISGASRNHS